MESLDQKGRGLISAAEGGKPRQVHIHATLPGESVSFLRYDRKGPADLARVLEVIEPSPDRVEPRCIHHDLCGGCSLMHMHPDAQVAHKQATLLAEFAAQGVTPGEILAPLRAEPWAYRRRARLGAKWVPNKEKVLVGFREKSARFIANLEGCEVLAGRGGSLIPLLSEVIETLSISAKLPQIEVSVADDQPDSPIALVLRVLEPPTDADLEILRKFGRTHDLRIFLQPGGLDTVAPLEPDTPELLEYTLPDFDLRLEFRPVDFVQVNAAINRAMITLAVDLLEVEPGHRALDLFCGLGNFSLALARRGATVLGVEGDRALVARAAKNAALNNIDSESARFELHDLYAPAKPGVTPLGWAQGHSFDRVLLDPPRSGAAEIVEHFEAIAAPRVVYVACSPATLARDAAVLIDRHGYRLEAAGVMDMFPHTAHVESIAVFVRD